MKTATQRFSNVLKEGFSPILKELGFKKKAQNYFRQGKELSHIINIQKDKWNSKEKIKFTINIGIFSDKFWLAEYDYDNVKILPKIPSEATAIIRKRIGDLKYDHDYWYTVEEQRLEWSLIDEVKTDLEKYVIPFLDQFLSMQQLIEYLTNNITEGANEYCLFVTLAEEGMKAQAQNIFDQLIKNRSELQLENLIETGKKYSMKI